MSDQVYGMDSFGKPPPNIIILGCFFDNTQALEDVDNIVNPSALDLQLNSYSIELEHNPVLSFKPLNEFFAELL